MFFLLVPHGLSNQDALPVFTGDLVLILELFETSDFASHHVHLYSCFQSSKAEASNYF